MRKLWKKWSEEGVRIPFVHDPVSSKPSVTLLFPYILFWLACISLIMLHFRPELALATWTTIGFWATSTVLYMFRKLHKAKFDFNSRSIELEAPETKPSSDSSE